MASLKERLDKWKQRKWYQKLGDIVFYLLIISLLIPGPRKFVATNVNRVALHLKKPSIAREQNAIQLTDDDFSWDVRDAEGIPLAPRDLKGKVIFLNYWGTFCPPCIAEMPEIQEIYNEYGDRVMFILISAEPTGKVHNFLEQHGYDLPAYFGGRNMPEKLSVRSIPTTFILSKEGKIVTRKVGAANWNSRATRKIFDELLAR